MDGTAAAAVRLFAGFAGFGAGSVNLAIASSLLAGLAGAAEAAGRAIHWLIPMALLPALWGVALIIWTVLALRNGRDSVPRTATVLLLLAAAVHLVSIAAIRGEVASGLNASHLAAILLTLMILASSGWLKRQQQSGNYDGVLPATASPRPGRLLLAAFAGAVAVAGVATPGLAASTAGEYAVPHGQHDSHAPDLAQHHP
ncbi:hypothetical protein [Pseudarthrobacter sp. N5]|uniref:hypothetical protein n=1 Tax=Pseudarthrobacter sp. N5 TaxID=3418416 RepID=UPI003CEC0221